MIDECTDKSITDLSRSNSLVDLAAKIKAAHTAVDTALKQSLQHAMEAGKLLIQAKAEVPHGQWLPWLRDHCAISERTAQLYMRVANNREDIELQIRNDVADLTLSQAAAVLALSSDVRRLFKFVRDLENLDDPEAVLAACLEANIPLICDPNYNPLAGRSEEETREWHSFIEFLSKYSGTPLDRAADHVEWVLQRPFQNVSEWLGPEGDGFRKSCGINPLPEKLKRSWKTFLSRELAHAEVAT
jgi:hypothetical protein